MGKYILDCNNQDGQSMGYKKKSLIKLSVFYIILVLLLTLTDVIRAQISNSLANFDYPEIEVSGS